MSFDSCVYWDAPKNFLSRSDNTSLIDSWLSGGWLSHIDAGIPASRTLSVQKLPRRGIFIYGANFWSATPKDTGLSNETIPRGVALRIREGQVNLYRTPFFYGHCIYISGTWLSPFPGGSRQSWRTAATPLNTSQMACTCFLFFSEQNSHKN